MAQSRPSRLKPSASGTSVSVWAATADIRRPAPLRRDVRCDACVVGAGIAGLTTAYRLSREGLSVAVLDDRAIGSGETSRTTAHLSHVLDRRYRWLEVMHGRGGARQVAESHSAAIRMIEDTAREEGIDCGFERLDGYLFNAPGGNSEDLAAELEAARHAGLGDAQLVASLPGSLLGAETCIRFPNQAQFHPLRYLAGLASSVRKRKGRIFGGTRVEKIEDGSPARVTTAGGQTVTAGVLVVATNSPIHTLVALHTKQAPYRTYVVAGRVPRGSVPKALYWDTESPYHYIRVYSDDGEDVLVVGGEDHKTGQEQEAATSWDALADWAHARFPELGPIDFRWSGQILESVDGLAFLGRTPGMQNVFLATGASGMGMTHGTIAGMLIADLAAGRSNPWEKLYDPSRIPVRALGEFARENLNVAVQYGELVTPGDVGSVREIAPGSGAVLRRGVHKVAVYRDPEGKLVERSAVCPHLGCIVAWNEAEKSWDCPCHGSRFDARGAVVSGPANVDLEPARG
jgi:glycine/D-amino acid oxidase-like deaminating enzyme/nitrite reductase/ring-hydroxylating ferredoxin subunit